MKREIKFRAWDKENKKMKYNITGIEYGNGDGNINGIFIDGDIHEIEKIELMQYTGLHDKNGKEIWENDIVEITREGIYEKGIIIFKNGCFFIKSKENLLALYNCELNNYKVKVIGNITDNPELLGGE